MSWVGILGMFLLMPGALFLLVVAFGFICVYFESWSDILHGHADDDTKGTMIFVHAILLPILGIVLLIADKHRIPPAPTPTTTIVEKAD